MNELKAVARLLAQERGEALCFTRERPYPLSDSPMVMVPIVMAGAGDPVATGLISSSLGPAETSPACRLRPSRVRVRDSNSFASCFRRSAASPFSPTRGGLSNGFFVNNNIATTAGLRFRY